MSVARRSRWSDASFNPVAVLALALLAYSLALEAGANGFVATFVAGLSFGTTMRDQTSDLAFTEDASQLHSLIVWFTFGAVMLVPGFRAADWQDLVFAVVALTFVRMVPVAISLIGSRLNRGTVTFIGWFGPRGLASIVFGLLAVDALDPGPSKLVLGAVTVTVALSVVAHGVTAGPLSGRYAERVKGLHRSSREHAPAPPIPTRPVNPRRMIQMRSQRTTE
jgi:NhaP-type Na+/H+ or K+/H+ antiporter